MPRTYSRETVREGCALFVSGLNARQVAQEMQLRGHKEFCEETMRRWAHQYDLLEAHTKNKTDNIKAAILFDYQCTTNDLIEAALNTRKKITGKLSAGGIDSIKVLEHLKKVDALIVSLVTITK